METSQAGEWRMRMRMEHVIVRIKHDWMSVSWRWWRVIQRERLHLGRFVRMVKVCMNMCVM